MTPAEQLAHWADRLRDLAAAGLKYAGDIYDRERYQALQQASIELLALANGQDAQELEPLRATIFTRCSPLVAGTAAVIDAQGRILLQRRADNDLWNMPGVLEVGETPAEGVAREVREETGIAVEPIALVGVYDNRRWETNVPQHLYKFTFLCRALDEGAAPREAPSHALETAELGWFGEDELPDNLFVGHVRRIADAFRVWRGEPAAHFD
jgi:ADP-ribose pyrophosphatase YjhB (NUDIX family)